MAALLDPDGPFSDVADDGEENVNERDETLP